MKEKQVEDMSVHALFEHVLHVCGGFGIYQIVVMAVASLSCLISATNHMAVLFMASTPDYRCADSPDTGNVSLEEACYVDPLVPSVRCTNFTYDTSVYSSTWVTQWDLVCDRLYLLAVLQASYFGGVIMGDLLGGMASDTFGRRPSLLIICAIHIVAAYSAIFVRDYGLFLFVRLFIGGSAHACWSILDVIIIEIVPIDKRTLVASVFNAGWKLGFGVLALLGYFLPSWPDLQLGIALINLIMIAFYGIIPESPRWLVARERFPEAEVVLRKMARWNSKAGKDNFEAEFQQSWTQLCSDRQHQPDTTTPASLCEMVKEVGVQTWSILKSPVTRRTFLLSTWAWFMCGMGYYGVFLSVKLLNASKYLITGITISVELIVIFFIIWPFNKIGRIPTLITTFLMGGTLGMMIMATSEDSVWIRAALVISGKMFSSVNFLGVGLYSAEVFPTSVRNAAFCFLDAFSKLGAALAPFVVDLLSQVDKGLPNLLIGFLTATAALPFLFLPETANKDIPQTVDEMRFASQDTLISKIRIKKPSSS